MAERILLIFPQRSHTQNELNHRDEKTILGVDQAHRCATNIRSKAFPPAPSPPSKPTKRVANLRSSRSQNGGGPPKRKDSTQDLINELRRELWAQAIRPEILTDFINRPRHNTKPTKSIPDICSSLFAATA